MIKGINFLTAEQAAKLKAEKIYTVEELQEKEVNGVIKVLWKNEYGPITIENIKRINGKIHLTAPKFPVVNEVIGWDINKIPVNKRPHLRKLYDDGEWEALGDRIEEYGVAELCHTCNKKKSIKQWFDLWINQGLI